MGGPARNPFNPEEFLQPGPCPENSEGLPECPPTSEIDCVVVEKVFDQCFKEDVITRSFAIPTSFCEPCKGVDLTRVDRIDCQVTSAACEVVDVSEPIDDNLRIVTVRQEFTLNVSLIDESTDPDTILCTFEETVDDFFNDVVLYVPPSGVLFGPSGGPFVSCEVVGTTCFCRPETVPQGQPIQRVLCTTKICKIIEVSAFVKLLLPVYGYCVPGPCEAAPQQQELNCPPTEFLFPPQQFDEVPEFPTQPPTPTPTPCPETEPRTRGFWGQRVPQLVETGVINKTFFVQNVLIPIVGPGGESPFLNNFFDDDLFDPEPDIDGIFDRYVELLNTSPVGELILQLAAQLFTTYLNIFGTSAGILDPDQLCLQFSMLASADIININTMNCTFDIDEDGQSTIQDLLEDAETILAACCPGGDFPCELENDQISDLLEIFDDINNDIGVTLP